VPAREAGLKGDRHMACTGPPPMDCATISDQKRQPLHVRVAPQVR
jgi:hypothetical protein